MPSVSFNPAISLRKIIEKAQPLSPKTAHGSYACGESVLDEDNQF